MLYMFLFFLHFYLMPLFCSKMISFAMLLQNVFKKMHVIWCKWWHMKKENKIITSYWKQSMFVNTVLNCLWHKRYIEPKRVSLRTIEPKRVSLRTIEPKRVRLACELSNWSGLACELCADPIATVATETWSNQNIYWKWMRCTEKKSPVHKSMIRCQSNKPTKLLVESRLKKDLNPCTYICLK